MRRRLVGAACAAVALVSIAPAAAQAPGVYEGWLYKASGERWKASFTTLTVFDVIERGRRFQLSVYNMRLACPYLDKYGRQARARFRFVQRGVVEGRRIDDTREYPSENPTHVVRVRGTFSGDRFAGRISVNAAPGVAGACEGSARVRVRR